jgi:hypothetical protein
MPLHPPIRPFSSLFFFSTSGGQSRVLLSKSLTSSSKGVRYFATKHLRLLYRSGIPSFASWGIPYLNKQVRSLSFAQLFGF